MARFLRLCTWLLALGPGLLATVRADCSQDCAACSLLARPAELSTETCILECEGKLSSLNTWGICKEFLHPSQVDLPRDSSRESVKADESHLLAKKYGGFMKKMDELYRAEPEEEEILAKRYGGFMKKDAEEEDGLNELVGTEAPREINIHQYSREDEPRKRYGGFMTSGKRSPEMEDEAKELQKRYGGFMRRVGRPEWWIPYKRYGGFLKRFVSYPPDKDWYPMADKRYGGFMKWAGYHDRDYLVY